MRADPAAVGALLDDAFREVGASGRVWDRPATIGALAADPGIAIEAVDLVARPLAADVVLVTYRAVAADRASHRSSIWVRRTDGWRLLHHQGTPIPARG